LLALTLVRKVKTFALNALDESLTPIDFFKEDVLTQTFKEKSWWGGVLPEANRSAIVSLSLPVELNSSLV
jgi:hypothetical protein